MTIKNPLHPEEVTPIWLTQALRSGGVIKNISVKQITKQILGRGKGYLSSIVLAKLDYDGIEANAPPSVIVKLEPEASSFRELGDELNAFQREVRFYEEVASTVSIRLPNIYFIVDQPPVFAIVMEDCSALTPGDQVVGMHEQQILVTLQYIATLQAQYWNNAALANLNWMPATNNLGRGCEEKWDVFIKHFGHYLTAQGLQIGEKLSQSITWLEQTIATRPKTIVHGDLREDNLLFGKPGTVEEVVILDWQVATRSIGAADVARLIGGSELPEERTGHQFNILRQWYDILIDNGVTGYSWEEAQYDLRLGALSCLIIPIRICDLMIDATGRQKELFKALVTRHFASAVEIDAQSALLR